MADGNANVGDDNAIVGPAQIDLGINGDGAPENQLEGQGGHHLQGGQHPQGQPRGIRELLRLQMQQANQQPAPAQEVNPRFLSLKCRDQLIPPAPDTDVTYMAQQLWPLSKIDIFSVELFAEELYRARGASATGTLSTVIATHIKDFFIRLSQHPRYYSQVHMVKYAN